MRPFADAGPGSVRLSRSTRERTRPAGEGYGVSRGVPGVRLGRCALSSTVDASGNLAIDEWVIGAALAVVLAVVLACPLAVTAVVSRH